MAMKIKFQGDKQQLCFDATKLKVFTFY